MRQLLYITITVLLSACSSESLPTFDNTDKTYPVNFKITDASFNIEEGNLKSTDNDTKLRLYTYFYNANGEIANYEEKAYDLSNTGSYTYTKDLLPGKYYVAFIADKNKTSADKAGFYIPKSFFTDYYNKSSQGIYYTTAEITVVAGNNNTQTESVNIKPMWSDLNIKIGDAQTFDIPEGTDALVFEVTPDLFGFGIQNKLASEPYPSYVKHKPDVIKVETVRANPTFTYTKALSKTGGDNSISVNLKYVKLDNDTVAATIQTRELSIVKSELDNGFIYSIKGNLGSNNPSNNFSISLGKFNPENTIIEF